MNRTLAPTSTRYDNAAPRWGDKMRALGYYDGYLGFLSAPQQTRSDNVHVVDIGSGTAAFSEAWVAINGAPRKLTLLDPSRRMLEAGHAALSRRQVDANLLAGRLGDKTAEPADIALAAHVIEHCPDPLIALRHIRAMLHPGGHLHLVVSKPHWCNAIIWLQWRHRTFRKDEIVSLLGQAGFDVRYMYDFPSGPPSRTSRGIVAVRQD